MLIDAHVRAGRIGRAPHCVAHNIVAGRSVPIQLRPAIERSCRQARRRVRCDRVDHDRTRELQYLRDLPRIPYGHRFGAVAGSEVDIQQRVERLSRLERPVTIRIHSHVSRTVDIRPQRDRVRFHSRSSARKLHVTFRRNGGEHAGKVQCRARRHVTHQSGLGS